MVALPNAVKSPPVPPKVGQSTLGRMGCPHRVETQASLPKKEAVAQKPRDLASRATVQGARAKAAALEQQLKKRVTQAGEQLKAGKDFEKATRTEVRKDGKVTADEKNDLKHAAALVHLEKKELQLAQAHLKLHEMTHGNAAPLGLAGLAVAQQRAHVAALQGQVNTLRAAVVHDRGHDGDHEMGPHSAHALPWDGVSRMPKSPSRPGA